MQKIALLSCFFGDFPWYFDFFIKSCDTNPTVDFIIFADRHYHKQLPENVRIIPFSLNDFNVLGSEKLGFTITVQEPYKICDFRPAFGVIFSDYLIEYDFWGMCDLDVILGRIREFMTCEVLAEYDVISTRHDYLSGWFMLFRNSPEINTLFMKSKDYQAIFSSHIHYCFDECNFKHLQLDDNKASILEIDSEVQSMEYVIRKEMEQGNLKVHFDLIMVDGLSGKIKWDHGVLTYANTFEILLYHLIRYKANEFTYKPQWPTLPDVFYIDRYTFRAQATKSISGFYDYFVYHFLRLSKQKAFFLYRYCVSMLYNNKIKAALPIGRFKNKLGDDSLYVANDNQNNTVLYAGNFAVPIHQLIASRFDNHTFYSKGNPRIAYHYSDSENEIPEIKVIHFDGSITRFELTKTTVL